MERLDRAEERLENVRSVEPILSALRTISMGSWQSALRQVRQVKRYGRVMGRIVPRLLAHLPDKKGWKGLFPDRKRGEKQASRRIRTLVIGSERGLCGEYNSVIVRKLHAYLEEQEQVKSQIDVAVLGSRLESRLQRAGIKTDWSDRLSLSKLPTYDLAQRLVHGWLDQFEREKIDAVDVVYNAYQTGGGYEPMIVRLIPPESDAYRQKDEPLWPPTIVETDPLPLYLQLAQQWIILRLYEILLSAAVAVHSNRYQLMESATQNAEELIEELSVTIQRARQEAITREMQELAAGAGLIGSDREE